MLMLWFFLIKKRHLTLLIMISVYLKWTFTEYKELLSIGLDRIWQIVHNDVSLMVPFLESVHLNAGYLEEQFLVPFYFLFTSTICLTSCQPRMYADDTHISYADVDINSIQLNLNHGLGNLNKWLISNKISLDTAKTEFMLIGSRQKLSTFSSQPELSIDNVPIGKVISANSLGIFIDENLRWQTHID